MSAKKQEEIIKDRAIERFEKKYGSGNDESLKKASSEDPELLKELILDEELQPLGRSHSLFALAHTNREEHFSFIKNFVQHESPFLREIAFRGLFQYYDVKEEKHTELKELFKIYLETEQSPGVFNRISSLLKEM